MLFILKGFSAACADIILNLVYHLLLAQAFSLQCTGSCRDLNPESYIRLLYIIYHLDLCFSTGLASDPTITIELQAAIWLRKR